MAKNKSRAVRWSEACAKAGEGVAELLALQSEYEEWKDNLPDSLQSSPVGEKLETVCSIDLESADTIIGECLDAELPQGFGRD